MLPRSPRLRPVLSLALVGLIALVTIAAVGPTLRIRSVLHGALTLTPQGTRVTIEADVVGRSIPFGPTDAQAVWTTDAARLELLRSGAVQELRIGAGQLQAQIATGATVSGDFAGVLRRQPSGHIEMDATFVITSGTGILGRVAGAGRLIGRADPATLDFTLTVLAEITR